MSASRLVAGRFGRLAFAGRLSARLSASWIGAFVRRLFASRERRAQIDEGRRRAAAKLLTDTMGQMKGLLMKLGQLVSFVSDDVPEELRTALASLQTSAPPMEFALIRDVVEQELGRPIERAFAAFDSTPIAAASIGQVHRARLPTGEIVAVKVQYPGVAEAIGADLDNATMLYYVVTRFYPELDPRPIVEELRRHLLDELDYVSEAAHQREFHALYRDHPFIRIPAVVDSHSTARVLTCEYVAGRRFAEILTGDAAARSRYGEIIYRFVFGSILRFHLFNADPHPGNYLFDDDGRVAFIDFGCVKHFPETMMQGWKSLVKAHLADDVAAFRGQAIELGFLKPSSDLDGQLLFDYFGYFYEPFQQDRAYTFSRSYTARSVRMVFAPEGEFAGFSRRVNMPADFVFVNRLQWGVWSILSTLEATRNWHRIHREILFDDPPSTELGKLDREYRIDRLRAEKHRVE